MGVDIGERLDRGYLKINYPRGRQSVIRFFGYPMSDNQRNQPLGAQTFGAPEEVHYWVYSNKGGVKIAGPLKEGELPSECFDRIEAQLNL